jgi:hypothetical protein
MVVPCIFWVAFWVVNMFCWEVDSEAFNGYFEFVGDEAVCEEAQDCADCDDVLDGGGF